MSCKSRRLEWDNKFLIYMNGRETDIWTVYFKRLCFFRYGPTSNLTVEQWWLNRVRTSMLHVLWQMPEVRVCTTKLTFPR